MINTIILASIFLALFISAEVMYHYFKVKVELTRKFVHLMTGLLTMLFPFMIGDLRYVFLLCLSFLVILLTSMKFNFLPSINAVERKTSGSILYPIIVFICFWIAQHYVQFIYYYIPILVLAVSDPVATLLGKKYPYGQYSTLGHTKTWVGSVAFFLATILISFVLIYINEDMAPSRIIMLAISIGATTTLAEAVSHNGFDNLTIPAAAALTIAGFYTYI